MAFFEQRPRWAEKTVAYKNGFILIFNKKISYMGPNYADANISRDTY